MSKTALLDVNVLVALFDPAHPHHGRAHDWLEKSRTRLGELRGDADGLYSGVEQSAVSIGACDVEKVASHLRKLCSDEHHVFWEAGVAFTDERRVEASHVAGHLGITDTYLLAMAVRHKGKLVTFDQSLAKNRGAAGAGLDQLVVL